MNKLVKTFLHEAQLKPISGTHYPYLHLKNFEGTGVHAQSSTFEEPRSRFGIRYRKNIPVKFEHCQARVRDRVEHFNRAFQSSVDGPKTIFQSKVFNNRFFCRQSTALG